MKIISIIPARGGSKSIPKKNLVSFLGNPLISKSIQQSKKSKLINRTFVSTDDEDIKLISKEYGAEVITRPNEISDDNATTESAILHAIEFLNKTENFIPDIEIQNIPHGLQFNFTIGIHRRFLADESVLMPK